MRKETLVGLSAALVFAGCRFLGWHGSTSNDDYRQEWASRSDGDYSFVMNRGCFCYPAGRFRVEVENYFVVEMIDLDRGGTVDSTAWENVHTIEQMFDLIDDAEREADVLKVSYAPEGYPTEIQIDWWEEAVDDELWYGVSEVELR
jgi:hypothetical protein